MKEEIIIKKITKEIEKTQINWRKINYELSIKGIVHLTLILFEEYQNENKKRNRK